MLAGTSLAQAGAAVWTGTTVAAKQQMESGVKDSAVK